MTPHKWEIWLVSMKFEDCPASKVRPALVLNDSRVVAKMTTHPPRDGYAGEYELIKWRASGLSRQTTLRLTKIVRLAEKDFLKKIGTVQIEDQINIIRILKTIP